MIARFIGAHHHKAQTELLALTATKGRLLQSTRGKESVLSFPLLFYREETRWLQVLIFIMSTAIILNI